MVTRQRRPLTQLVTDIWGKVTAAIRSSKSMANQTMHHGCVLAATLRDLHRRREVLENFQAALEEVNQEGRYSRQLSLPPFGPGVDPLSLRLGCAHL